MEVCYDSVESELKSYLQIALAREEVADFSVEITGNSEKGDGYMGDILFVEVTGKSKKGAPKKYDLVLKRSKKSKALRESVPVHEVFINEIYVYNTVFPAFARFQNDKGVDKIFHHFPKYYGSHVGQNIEVIVLENLKKAGYEMADKRKPLDLKRLTSVLELYAKLHAISAAMQDQRPQEFNQLTENLIDMIAKYDANMNSDAFFGPPIEQVYNLIKDELPESMARKWLDLKTQAPHIATNLFQDTPCFKVITHGDCWINNFMFTSEDEAVILDWPMAYLMPPVRDLSYFIYSCISKEDLRNLDAILKIYHARFSNCVKVLGSDPERIYPFAQLVQDWKRFARHGLLFTAIVLKFCVTDKEEVVDVIDLAEHNVDVMGAFSYEVTNKNEFKERILCIVQHVIERGFI